MKHEEYMKAVIDMIIEETPLESILDYIGSMVKSTIILTDEDFRMMGYGNMKLASRDEIIPDMNKGIMIFNSVAADEIQQKLLEQPDVPVSVNCRFNHREEDFRIYPVKKDKKIVACLCVGFDMMSDVDDELLCGIANILKIEVTKYNLELKNAVHSKTDFVTHVLLGNITDKKELMALCNINGFDYSLSRICIFIRSPRHKESDDHAQRSINVKVNAVINDVCKEENLHTYKLHYNNNIILFLLFSKETNALELNQYGPSFAAMLEKELNKYVNVSCGVGKCYQGIDTLSKSFRESVKAINLGDKLYNGQRVHSYDRDLVYHILYDCMSYKQLSELYEETVRILDETDQDNSGELSLTLKKYMECNYKAMDTAKSMHLHRNTLAYRLDKIKEILNYEFDDHMTNMKIQLGIFSKELLDIYDSI